MVYALNKNKPFGRELAIAWNFLGLLDFAIALVTGMAFIGPYVRHLALTGQSIAYLDYVLMIPGFAVPILVLMHINSLFNLLTWKEAVRTTKAFLLCILLLSGPDARMASAVLIVPRGYESTFLARGTDPLPAHPGTGAGPARGL